MRYPERMERPASRDEILEQIRSLPLEDREYIEAELMREAYETARRVESATDVAELVRRANDALSTDRGFSREESVARATAAVEATRTRKR